MVSPCQNKKNEIIRNASNGKRLSHQQDSLVESPLAQIELPMETNSDVRKKLEHHHSKPLESKSSPPAPSSFHDSNQFETIKFKGHGLNLGVDGINGNSCKIGKRQILNPLSFNAWLCPIKDRVTRYVYVDFLKAAKSSRAGARHTTPSPNIINRIKRHANSCHLCFRTAHPEIKSLNRFKDPNRNYPPAIGCSASTCICPIDS